MVRKAAADARRSARRRHGVGRPSGLPTGYRDYQRYRLTLKGEAHAPLPQTRDVLHGGKVVAVLPVDLARDEIVLIRQFRLPAHLANGRGDLRRDRRRTGGIERNTDRRGAPRMHGGDRRGAQPRWSSCSVT